jgi:hypothetical protein
MRSSETPASLKPEYVRTIAPRVYVPGWRLSTYISIFAKLMAISRLLSPQLRSVSHLFSFPNKAILSTVWPAVNAGQVSISYRSWMDTQCQDSLGSHHWDLVSRSNARTYLVFSSRNRALDRIWFRLKGGQLPSTMGITASGSILGSHHEKLKKKSKLDVSIFIGCR